EPELAEKLGVGEATIRDILENLARPGRDPREDLPKPIFRKGILRLEDLTEGMQLQGTVLNVVDFGAFVDVGLKDSCLVHISELANRYIRSPHDVVAVGDIVTTWVLKVDPDRRRVSLTMIAPGTVRAHQGHRPKGGRPQRSGSGRRPAAAPAATDGQAAATQPRTVEPRQAPGPRHPQRSPASAKKRKKTVKVQHRRNPGPTPKLSNEALEGKAALHTFGELKAFFDHKQRKKGDSDS